MPCVILFAAAAITAICRHQFTLRRFRAYLLTFASVLVFLFVAATNFSIALTNLAGENWLIVMTVLQSLLRLGVYAAVIFLCLRFALCLNMPQRATVALALTLFFLAAPQVCLPLRIYGRWYEWKQAFNQKGTIVAQTIRLSDERIKQMSLRQSYVIIDLENGAFTANDIRVRMNGVPLDSFNIPIMSLASDGRNNMALPNGTVCPEIEYILNDIVFFTGGFPEQLRQWYLLPIGADQLARALAVGESKGIAKNTMIITLEKLSDNANAIYGAYRTDPRFLLIPSVTQFSWEKGFCGLENPDGFTDFALDTKIGLPVEKGENEVTSRDAVSQPPNPFVRILVSPPVAGAHSGLLELTGDSKLSQLVAPAHGITAADTAVAACGRADALKVIRFSADLDAKPGSPDLSVGVIAQLRKLDGAPLLYPSKWCPQIVSAKSPTTHLDFSFPIAPGCLSARLTGLTATLASVDYFQTPNVLSTDVGGVERNLRFRIYDLPNNPISAGHEIY